MKNNFQINILSQKKAFSLSYTLLFLIFYMIAPLFFVEDVKSIGTNTLALISFISILGFLISLNIEFGKKIKFRKVELEFKTFANFVFIVYILVVAVIFFTAGEIPLIASLRGASQEDLFGLREGFLKKREGWEAFLSYIITVIDSAILPFIIIYAYNVKYKLRHLYLGSFIFYSLSFLEKAYFFKIAIPLFIYYYFISTNKKSYLIVSGSVILGIVSLMFLISKFDSAQVERDDPFFSVMHTPNSVSEAVLWRSIAVPVVTASQGVELFYTNYNGKYFFGATSSSISSIFGLERINFERQLYQSQFGGQETGNANQCYLVEAFVNFGFIGVFIFSLMIGKLVKGIIRNKDIAALCIMPLFIYNLFNSGFIGNMLSNGFLLFFLLMSFFTIKMKRN